MLGHVAGAVNNGYVNTSRPEVDSRVNPRRMRGKKNVRPVSATGSRASRHSVSAALRALLQRGPQASGALLVLGVLQLSDAAAQNTPAHPPPSAPLAPSHGFVKLHYRRAHVLAHGVEVHPEVRLRLLQAP